MGKIFKYRAEKSPQAWFYIFPALLIIGIFNIKPLFNMFYLAFQKGTLTNPTFNGLKNFEFVLNDPKFHLAIKNTALYAFTVVPIGLITSLAISYVIHEYAKRKEILETVFFLPYLTSIIAVGVVFRYLFNGDYGLINYVLNIFGIKSIDFLNNPRVSMLSVIIFGIWNGLAFQILILSTGLKNISKDYYKIADMFGATKREQFRKITLPQLIPTITFLLLVNFIGAFKVYSQVFSIFNGSPGVADSATTGVFYVFTKFYTQQRYGQGMAAAVILFFIILIFTVIQNQIMKRVAR